MKIWSHHNNDNIKSRNEKQQRHNVNDCEQKPDKCLWKDSIAHRVTAGGDQSVEQVIMNHISGMRDRLEANLSSSESVDDRGAVWADVWIQEEALLEVNHAEAIMTVPMSSKMTTYLSERKDRVLDFLWSICRDASDVVTRNEELRQAIQQFTYREERILQLYTVKFIRANDRVNLVVPVTCT